MRAQAIKDGKAIDWSTAESLAFGTLLTEGFSVRLSGQDSGRGTFSQRHAVLRNQENHERYIPLNNIYKGQKNFEIIGSAHNIKEIINKEIQGCTKIFLCPLFKTKKNKHFLGVKKFNLIKLNSNKDVISLGGINEKNVKRLKICSVKGLAGISWIKKNGPSINTGPF